MSQILSALENINSVGGLSHGRGQSTDALTTSFQKLGNVNPSTGPKET